jgi:hypothetical protein
VGNYFWSGDSHEIAFSVPLTLGFDYLYVANLENETLRAVGWGYPQNSVFDIRWSPNGTHLMVIYGIQTNGRIMTFIDIINADSGDVLWQLISDYAVWSPDSGTLAYVSPNNEICILALNDLYNPRCMLPEVGYTSHLLWLP